MSAGTSEFFCLICLLVCSCTAQKIITAERGQDVILPCKVPNIKNISDIRALEWIRPELDPEYVLLYRNKRFDPDSQNPSYQNRVDLQDKEMKDGNFSLILKNVTMEDTGTYLCHVSQKTKKDLISTIFLKVHLSAQKIITAELGQDAILPCKVPNININDITALEWSRPELDSDHVLLYKDGRLYPDIQHPSYQNRVDLQDKEMKDGDVSLILKNVKMEDTGTYECQVSQKGKKDLISIINLEVVEPHHSWKIIVGVFGVIILLIPAVLCCWKMKKKWQTEIKRLKGSNSDLTNQVQTLYTQLKKLKRSNSDPSIELQLVKLKNEALENQLKGLKGNNSETINQLQKEKLTKETLMNQLMKLKGNNSEIINPLQKEKLKNETLMNHLMKLERGFSDPSSQLKNEAVMNKLMKLKRSNSDASSELQLVTWRNEFLERRLKELEQMGSIPEDEVNEHSCFIRLQNIST